MLIGADRVKETFNGQTVWEGTVHVFDLEGRPAPQGDQSLCVVESNSEQ